MIDGVVTDRFLRNWLDLLCFLLGGLPADGIIAAEVRAGQCSACDANMGHACVLHGQTSTHLYQHMRLLTAVPGHHQVCLPPIQNKPAVHSMASCGPEPLSSYGWPCRLLAR